MNFSEKDATSCLNKRAKNGIALKVKEDVEVKSKSSKSKKEDTSDEEDSTDEGTALLMRNLKSFLKKKKKFQEEQWRKGKEKIQE